MRCESCGREFDDLYEEMESSGMICLTPVILMTRLMSHGFTATSAGNVQTTSSWQGT